MPAPLTRADFAGLPVLVAGAGVSGAAAARALLSLGAEVRVTAEHPGPATEALERAGAAYAGNPSKAPDDVALVVTSPGLRPDNLLLASALARGIEVIGEVELAWRIRGERPAPWLAVTGTNGKTTTVTMLEAILRAAGLRAVAAGNVGLPIVEVVLEPEPYDVIAVELSSFQLYWSSSVAVEAAAILNVADDHLDWHGTMEAYAAAKRNIYRGGGTAVYNADDEWSARLSADAGSQVGFGLGAPAGPDDLGVVDGVLVDGRGTRLLAVDELRVTGPHNVSNALAAAALARSHGVAPEAVRDGLRGYQSGAHRNELVSTRDGVAFVNDSKATNAHAALASLTAYDRIVWIAGGLLKGASVDDLGGVLDKVRDRLAGIVLIGVDRSVIRAAHARHAPDVPLVEVTRTDDGAMAEAVGVAAGLAGPDTVVLLAPAAASMDMFTNYGARGDAFAAAVRALGTG